MKGFNFEVQASPLIQGGANLLELESQVSKQLLGSAQSRPPLLTGFTIGPSTLEHPRRCCWARVGDL